MQMRKGFGRGRKGNSEWEILRNFNLVTDNELIIPGTQKLVVIFSFYQEKQNI